MPRAVTLGTKMLAGLLKPSRMGPTGSPSALAFSRLNALLAASTVGMTNRLAVPDR